MIFENLKNISKEVRKDIIDMVYWAGSGHPGGALSIADILVYLYFEKMNIDVNNPKADNRDRLVLSKGHCCTALYAVLAEKGFIPKEDLKGFRQVDSYLEGHPDMKKINGIDMSSGSLGQGLSVANGMALAAKMDNKDYRVYCILGDGEIEEGQVWEAAMSASHYKLDNLCVVIDNNDLQIDGTIENVMNSKPIDRKFESFGFNVINIDGSDFVEMDRAFRLAEYAKGRPTAIIAKTIKGKGVSFMENKVEWHGKAPNEEQYNQAIKDIMSK